MLDDNDVLALLGGRHGDPFAVLGLHADGDGRLWLRALLPGASEVRLLDADSGKPLCSLPLRHPSGLFEGAGAAPPEASSTTGWKCAGPTATSSGWPMPTRSDRSCTTRTCIVLRDGRHPRPYTVLGAHLQRQRGVAGVRFALWAPNARRVSVVGDFNGWDGRRHPMRLRMRPASGRSSFRTWRSATATSSN